MAVGRRVPRSQRIYPHCPLGDIGDEHHLIFRCSAVQHIRDSYSGLFRANVQTMIQSMWQDDLVSVVEFVVQCLDFLQAASYNPP